MERVERLIRHPRFLREMEKLRHYEATRSFCGHDLSHLMDVARLMAIENCKQKRGYDESILYATALLHDIGRAAQYETGEPHAPLGARLAEDIFLDCGFTREEAKEMTLAISQHGTASVREEAGLSGMLYRADKQSRPCYWCQQRAACNWPEEKKTKHIL